MLAHKMNTKILLFMHFVDINQNIKVWQSGLNQILKGLLSNKAEKYEAFIMLSYNHNTVDILYLKNLIKSLLCHTSW